MTEARQAGEFLAEVASDFAPTAQVLAHSSGHLFIELQSKKAQVSLSRAQVDDLSEALTRDRAAPYNANLLRRFRVKVAISLMESDIAPDIGLAHELIGGGDEWPDKKFVDISLPNPFAQIIVAGLRSLYEALTTVIANSPVTVPAIAEDAANVHYLIKYYEEAANLSSRGAGKENLGYIRGAAICAIADLEEKRQSTTVGRIKSAINQQIISIAEWVESEPYSKLPTPQCVIEYLQTKSSISRSPVDVPRLDSLLSTSGDRLDKYLEALGPTFTRRRQGAWEAFQSENPDRLSQAANSMVELLNNVLGKLCEGTTLESFLIERFGAAEEMKWVDATRKWIGETKSNLQRVKHYDDFTSESLTESLMKSAESVIKVLLSEK